MTEPDLLFAPLQLDSPELVDRGKALISDWDEHVPSAEWPTTESMLAEIDRHIEAARGPLTTPSLNVPRAATWDEVRARIEREKLDEPTPSPRRPREDWRR